MFVFSLVAVSLWANALDYLFLKILHLDQTRGCRECKNSFYLRFNIFKFWRYNYVWNMCLAVFCEVISVWTAEDKILLGNWYEANKTFTYTCMLMGGVYVCPCTGPCTKVQRSLQPAVLSAVKCSMTEAIWAVTSRYTVTARNTDVRIVRKDSINGSRTTCICVYIQVRYICISFTKEYLNLSWKLSYISEECQKQFVYLLENLQTLTPPPQEARIDSSKNKFFKISTELITSAMLICRETNVS